MDTIKTYRVHLIFYRYCLYINVKRMSNLNKRRKMNMILEFLISIFGEKNLCISIFAMAIVFVVSGVVFIYEAVVDRHPIHKKIANVVRYVSAIYVLLMVALILIAY